MLSQNDRKILEPRFGMSLESSIEEGYIYYNELDNAELACACSKLERAYLAYTLARSHFKEELRKAIT